MGVPEDPDLGVDEGWLLAVGDALEPGRTVGILAQRPGMEARGHRRRGDGADWIHEVRPAVRGHEWTWDEMRRKPT